MNLSRFPLGRATATAVAALSLWCAAPAQAELLEYDGFDYTGTALNSQGGGTGWAANTWSDPDNDAPLSGDALSLEFLPVVSFTPTGARLSFPFSGEAERRLGTPMAINVETNFYFSALVKRQGDFRIEFLDNANNARWRLGASGMSGVASNAVVGVSSDVTVANVFPTDETVLMVGKIRARASANDEVSLNVYRAGQVVPANEPSAWQATAAAASGVSLTRLQVRNISDLPLEIDEIRVGSSFASVAGPRLTGAPVITTLPQSRTNYQGTDARFTVEGVGELPFTYQWTKNDQVIQGATGASLTLTNVSAADAGSYRVQITNPSGTTNSPAAVLTVIMIENRNVGLQAFWTFDEKTGLVAHDLTTNQNNGTLMNFLGDDSQWIASYENGALALNGSSYVEVPDSPSVGEKLRNSFSASIWFKSNVPLSSNGNQYRLMEKENSFFLLQGDGNAGNLGVGGMNVLVKKAGANLAVGIGTNLLANQWYHLAVTYDGTLLKLFLNGDLRGSREVAAPIDGSSLPLNIGADYMAGMTGAKYLNGAIDEVGLWDRPLLQSEILQLAGRAGLPRILEQPQSQTKYVGGTARFAVTARGQEPLRYLWYHGTEEIRTANGPVLNLVNVQPGDAGQYRCRVSNDLGEMYSSNATLVVNAVTSINDALQAAWKFDETSGMVAADSSTFSRSGDLLDYFDPVNTWVPGKVGNALNFDGSVNRVVSTGATNMVLGTDATLSFWIRPASYGSLEILANYNRNIGRVLHKGGLIDIQTIDDPGSVRATLVANGVSAQQNSLELNAWQHFTIVYQGNTVSFYKNGFRLGDPVPGSLGADDTNALVLGNISDQQSPFSYFQGALDEVKIWSRVLGETEILEQAAQDVSGPPVIVNQPVSATRYSGGSVSFVVGASGKRPLTYEWLRNGTPIPNSNTNRLALGPLTTGEAGTYTVTIENGVGSPVTSSPATLTVKEISGITTGLIAYWPFNETSGTVLNDASGRGHHGALQNFEAMAGNVGVIGGSFMFDGIDDFIVVPHAPELNLQDQASISVWVSPVILGASSAGGLGRIVRKDINMDLTLYAPANTMRMYGQNKTAYDAPANSVDTNQWQHLAVVVKDGTVEFFKNGRSLGAPLPGALGPSVTNDLIIANFGPDMSILRLFQGNMDELGIWDRALSAAEVDGIYQNGLLGKSLNATFEPLAVRSITPAGNQAKLAFYSPYAGREHLVQIRTNLAEGDWAEAAGVVFTTLGNGMIEATVAIDGQSAFYRVGLKPQPALFFQDFESSAQGWTHGGSGDNWEWGTPVNGPGQAYSGTKVYATSLTGNLLPYTDSFLRSPNISLAGRTRATLSFREWRNVDPNVTFHRTVVNLWDAATMTLVQQLSVAAGGTTGYELRTLPLPAQVMGKNIFIDFQVVCDDYNLLEGWYIDDVMIVPE